MRNDNEDIWVYWAQVNNQTMAEAGKQDDWLAWLRFRAKVIGPFD